MLIIQEIGKDLFKVLKKMWGGEFDTLISEKVCVVPGEVSLTQMGLIDDSNLVEEMKNQVEIIVNLAATTKFDERYKQNTEYFVPFCFVTKKYCPFLFY